MHIAYINIITNIIYTCLIVQSRKKDIPVNNIFSNSIIWEINPVFYNIKY